MVTTLLTAGVACLIAAVIGGGLKAFGVEIPALQSGRRQLALGALGVALTVSAFWVSRDEQGQDAGQSSVQDVPSPPRARPTPDDSAAAERPPVTQRQELMGKATLAYAGSTEILRRKTVTEARRSPNNHENRGDCPNKVGYRDGKYCISRTTVSLTTTAPTFFKNAQVSCRGGGCPWTELGPATLQQNELTASAYVDNWGSAVDVVLSVDEYERVTAAQCGQGSVEQITRSNAAVFTIQKKCMAIATIRWNLSDGSSGVLAAGDKSSHNGQVVLDRDPIDGGDIMTVAYRIESK